MKQLRFSILIVLLIVAGIAQAQDDFSTPQRAVRSFFENMYADEPDVSTASKIISSRHIFSKRKREELARELKAYIDANSTGDPVFDSIPDIKDYEDSVSGQHAYRLNENFELVKIGNHWYLSKETINQIPDLIEQSQEQAEEVTDD